MQTYTDKQTAELCATFLDELRQTLTEEEWFEMVARNVAEEDPRICHSHDFCDANEVMLAAFARQGHRFINLGLWDAAWHAARPALRGRLK